SVGYDHLRMIWRSLWFRDPSEPHVPRVPCLPGPVRELEDLQEPAARPLVWVRRIRWTGRIARAEGGQAGVSLPPPGTDRFGYQSAILGPAAPFRQPGLHPRDRGPVQGHEIDRHRLPRQQHAL